MIRQFCVKNYKSLKHVDVELSKIHILIGQNDSGKTSLLEAIHAFCGSAVINQPVASAFGGKWQGRELVCLDATEPVYLDATGPVVEFSARLEGTLDGKDVKRGYGFSVSFTPGNSRECEVVREWSFNRKSSSIPHHTRSITGLASRHKLMLDREQLEGLDLETTARLLGPASYYFYCLDTSSRRILFGAKCLRDL